MFQFSNYDLFSVGIAVVAIGILGFSIYLNNRNSITNKTFLSFSIITIFWSIANYLYYQVGSTLFAFYLLRFVIFLGVWHAFNFFQLFYVFPNEKVIFSKGYKYVFVPLIALTSFVTLTPLVFSSVSELSDSGVIVKITNGPAIALFGIVVMSLILATMFLLIKKVLKARGIERKQLVTIIIGTFITFFLIITFNFLLPSFFDNPNFIPLSAVFLFPLIAFTSYAIYKHRLFNLKIAATALLTALLNILSFVNIVYSKELSQVLLNSSALVLIFIGSISLIRTVLKEVEAREKIQRQEKEMEVINQKLAEANDRQEGLIHFISHEVKGYLTKGRNAFSVIADGDYGAISADMKTLVDKALHEMTEGVSTVMNILDASNLKKGTTTYKMVPFDFKNAVSKVVSDLKLAAAEKGLQFDFAIDDKQDYTMNGDEENISKHVIRNLIDNAVRYTPAGNIKVELSKSNGKILFSVKDSGVGITEKDKVRLFTEGGKGTNSMRVNVNSTGYGLYIAKEIVLAHHGRIWAESAGDGKGSQFFVEI